jgi:hypothetical protein
MTARENGLLEAFEKREINTSNKEIDLARYLSPGDIERYRACIEFGQSVSHLTS